MDNHAQQEVAKGLVPHTAHENPTEGEFSAMTNPV